MKIRREIFRNIMISLLFCVVTPDLPAQAVRVDSLVRAGDSLRTAYRFDESLTAYKKAMEAVGDVLQTRQDSLLKITVSDRILLSENGKSMTGFVYSPNVVARHKFSLDDFYLYYPLKDMSWRPVPNQLDSVPGPYSKAIYAPPEDKAVYYSAPDGLGIRNIYRTTYADSIWTMPALLNEQMTSASDEIYPMLSPDGRSLYFASEGLYGAGGYDLYVSRWDEASGDWSVPVNMGFPYSSPANDFLLVNTEDGRYTVFASDRECSGDSVWVYVLEYDNMPVRSEVTDPAELSELSRLEPPAVLQGGSSLHDVRSEIPGNVDTQRYMEKMAHVRALRDSISICETALAEDREKYMMADADREKEILAGKILKGESMMPAFRARLDEAVRQLQDIEMDFLFSGVVIDPDSLLAEAEREVVGEMSGYMFSRMTMGEPLTLEMEKPEPKFDYSFRILEEARFAEDMTIPQGIVYQIQLYTVGSPTSLNSLKGLSPVYELRSSSGRYIYRAGLFNTYADVLSHLNSVKRLGFRSAYIVGYVDGKEMPVKKVRSIEAERKAASVTLFRVMIIPAGGELDGVAMEGVRQQAAGKDVARVEGGLMVGPFDNRTDAVALVEFVEVMGYGDAELETIQND